MCDAIRATFQSEEFCGVDIDTKARHTATGAMNSHSLLGTARLVAVLGILLLVPSFIGAMLLLVASVRHPGMFTSRLPLGFVYSAGVIIGISVGIILLKASFRMIKNDKKMYGG